MKYKVEKLISVSGRKASIYSIRIDDEVETIFEQFVTEFGQHFRNEIDEITAKVYNIGHKYGARNQFFRLKEGKGGDLVMAFMTIQIKN